MKSREKRKYKLNLGMMFLSQRPDWALVLEIEITTFPSVLLFVLRVGKSDSGYEIWIDSNRH